MGNHAHAWILIDLKIYDQCLVENYSLISHTAEGNERKLPIIAKHKLK